MKFALFMLLINLFYFCSYQKISDKLTMVIQVYRHGARQLIHDVFSENPKGIGELTSVGIEEHKVLGQKMREIYINQKKFLSPTFNGKEMNIISTDVNRTIMSAISQLYGFYPLEFRKINTTFNSSIQKKLLHWKNKNNEQLEDQQLYEQIPIQTINNQQNYMFATHNICPNYKNYIELQDNSKFSKELKKNFTELFEKLENQFHFKKHSLNHEDIYNLVDTLTSKEFLEQETLHLDETTIRDIIYLHSLYVPLILFGKKEQQQLGTTQLLNASLNILNKKITDENYQLKWQTFSAHDTNIQAILESFKLMNYQCIFNKYNNITDTKLDNEMNGCVDHFPRYTSNFLIELYNNSTNINDDINIKEKYYIKILYNGEYQNICNLKQKECNFKIFEEKLRQNILSKEQFSQYCFGEY